MSTSTSIRPCSRRIVAITRSAVHDVAGAEQFPGGRQTDAGRCSVTRQTFGWADFTQQGFRLYGAANPAGVSMHTASRFFQHLHRDMARAAEHWRHTLADQPHRP
ncbi:hypothetical protein [Nonomuraea sp. NPDC050691]|uniref:hypothetical protein n=1 Tax=Nonomuraea sp. NPDC050691 TaxID=3155661 RepID=UPI0033F69ABD